MTQVFSYVFRVATKRQNEDHQNYGTHINIFSGLCYKKRLYRYSVVTQTGVEFEWKKRRVSVMRNLSLDLERIFLV